MKLLQKTLDDIVLGQKADKRAHPAIMTHVVLGYPSLAKSLDIVRAMASSGARIIELQIPFSDPIADGPTIMAANEASLASGMKVKDSFRAAECLAKELSTPLLFMSYFNILYRYSRSPKSRVDVRGVESFCKDAASAGVQGLIIPDVPPEENSEYWAVARKNRLAAIPIVTPVSTAERLRLIRSVTNGGFVYCVTTTGTTGARKTLPKEVPQYLRRIRKTFENPLAVGFGISSRRQVSELAGVSDIAIVGSAVIDRIRQSPPKDVLKNVSRFVQSLA